MKTTKTYIGIDISKERLDLAALAPDKEEWSLSSNAGGFARLIAQLVRWPQEVVVVC